jgi:hypothetical protein
VPPSMPHWLRCTRQPWTTPPRPWPWWTLSSKVGVGRGSGGGQKWGGGQCVTLRALLSGLCLVCVPCVYLVLCLVCALCVLCTCLVCALCVYLVLCLVWTCTDSPVYSKLVALVATLAVRLGRAGPKDAPPPGASLLPRTPTNTKNPPHQPPHYLPPSHPHQLSHPSLALPTPSTTRVTLPRAVPSRPRAAPLPTDTSSSLELAVASWLGNAKAALSAKLRSDASSGSGAADPVFAVDVLAACALAGVDNGDSLAPVKAMIFDAAHPLTALEAGGGPSASRDPGPSSAAPVGSWSVFAAVDSNAVSVPTRRFLVEVANLDYVAAATLVRIVCTRDGGGGGDGPEVGNSQPHHTAARRRPRAHALPFPHNTLLCCVVCLVASFGGLWRSGMPTALSSPEWTPVPSSSATQASGPGTASPWSWSSCRSLTCHQLGTQGPGHQG